MNWAQFKKKGVGMWVQLEPIAYHLDQHGNELPERNDDWIVERISTDDVVLIKNVKSTDVAKLGKDHIFDFRSNPNRSQGDIKHGFLVLKVQIYLQENTLWLRPNARPGERVSPHRKPAVQSMVYSGDRPSTLPGSTIRVLADLEKQGGGWAGTPAEFNKHAARIIHGTEFANLLTHPVDYYSALIFNDYISIVSLTDNGNLPDGTPRTTVFVVLTQKATEVLGKGEPKLLLKE